MVSIKECGRQVFFFPDFLLTLFCLWSRRGKGQKVYLRLQIRDVKGETNTLMMGIEKQVGNRKKKRKVKLTGFHNYIDLEEQ